MSKMNRFDVFLLLLLFLTPGSLLFGQDEDELRLDLDFGYRWEASFDGSRDLYRSQIDLGEGPKLFAGDLFFAPAEGSNQLFDRLQLSFDNWGGEPYNTSRIRMAKNGVYELDFHYQNIAYFNSIPSFANPLFESGVLQSQHKEDTSLRTFGFDLRLLTSSKFSPIFSYQRTTRHGPVRTTLPADGDEFLIRQDLDFSSDDFRGGIIFQLPNFSIAAEQGVRWYRDLSTFSGGPQAGNSERPLLGRDVFLDQYQANQDFKSRAIPYSIVRATFLPVESLTLKGHASYSLADFRTQFYETLSGNFFSFPELRAFYGSAESRASGRFMRPNLLVDLSAQWEPTDRLRIIERFKTHRYHVSGSRLIRSSFFQVDPLLENRILDEVEDESVLTDFLGLDHNRQQLEAQVDLSSELTLRVGHRYETQELELLAEPGFADDPDDFRGGLDMFDWERNVLILGGTYRHSSKGQLSVDYELGRTDRPIFRTDVVDFDRLRIYGRVKPLETLEISGRVTLFDHDDEIVDFVSENRGYGLQFSYRPVERVTVAGQWERTEWETSIPYLVPQNFMQDLFTFRELGNYGNFFLDLLMVRNSRLTLGYAVWGNSGDFPVNYHQPFARVEVPLAERLSAYGEWKYYDYNEKLELFPQDYRTHQAILGFKVSLEK